MPTRALVFALITTAFLLGCGLDKGDWLGPVERGLRAAFNGWDMWSTEAVRPYEDPMPQKVEGTVATEDELSIQPFGALDPRRGEPLRCSTCPSR
jgi:hypothetical protein